MAARRHHGRTQFCRLPAHAGAVQTDRAGQYLVQALDSPCYLEPLLRWLQWGGRGYQYGCTQHQGPAASKRGRQHDAEQQDAPLRHALGSLAFADDLLALTDNLEDLGVQLTMTLDWRHQIGAMTDKLKDRLQCLRESYASPTQVRGAHGQRTHRSHLPCHAGGTGTQPSVGPERNPAPAVPWGDTPGRPVSAATQGSAAAEVV
mmetsp:Transcript_19057/g.48435  ORF Transcript_19057/g.48435 Transcript_19057/m.48435 type:complete len:204 (-) Transcript_19057:344-955(-)